MTISNPSRVTEAGAGCWVDGHWGQYASAHLVQRAIALGYRASPELAADAAAWLQGGSDLTDEQLDSVIEADQAIFTWLDAHVAPPGYSFGWHDGEVFLWSEEVWAED